MEFWLILGKAKQNPARLICGNAGIVCWTGKLEEIPGKGRLSWGFQGQAGYGSPGWDVAYEVSCSFSGCFFAFALFFLLSSGSVSS